jgi:hypothetical protein
MQSRKNHYSIMQVYTPCHHVQVSQGQPQYLETPAASPYHMEPFLLGVAGPHVVLGAVCPVVLLQVAFELLQQFYDASSAADANCERQPPSASGFAVFTHEEQRVAGVQLRLQPIHNIVIQRRRPASRPCPASASQGKLHLKERNTQAPAAGDAPLPNDQRLRVRVEVVHHKRDGLKGRSADLGCPCIFLGIAGHEYSITVFSHARALPPQRNLASKGSQGGKQHVQDGVQLGMNQLRPLALLGDSAQAANRCSGREAGKGRATCDL